MERFRTETYLGKTLVVVDGTDARADEYPAILRDGAAFVTARPRGSVLLATVVKGARYGAGAADNLKAYSKAIRPHVVASAVVGLSPLQRVIFSAIRPFLHASVKEFPTLAEARVWLAGFDPPKA